VTPSFYIFDVNVKSAEGPGRKGGVADCAPEEDSMYPGLNLLIYGYEVYTDSTLNPSPPPVKVSQCLERNNRFCSTHKQNIKEKELTETNVTRSATVKPFNPQWLLYVPPALT
jgi:hypothetical protein